MSTVTNPTKQALWCDALKRVLDAGETADITAGQEVELTDGPIFVVSADAPVVAPAPVVETSTPSSEK